MTKKNKNEERDILDILLDDSNDEPIYLFDENKNKVAFEKVAIINLDGELFFLLSPLDVIDGVGEDEALVFKIVESNDGKGLLVGEEDASVIDAVFTEYYRLLEEAE